MTTVHERSREELVARRKAILQRLGVSEEEFRARVDAGSLVGDEWSAWSEIQNIDFLLGEHTAG